MIDNAKKGLYPALVFLIEERNGNVLKKSFAKMNKPM